MKNKSLLLQFDNLLADILALHHVNECLRSLVDSLQDGFNGLNLATLHPDPELIKTRLKLVGIVQDQIALSCDSLGLEHVFHVTAKSMHLSYVIIGNHVIHYLTGGG